MFKIKDYKVINNKVVIVTFESGETIKAVCDDRDTFDFETGITVCIMKYFLGEKEYNSAIKEAMRQVKLVDKKHDAEKESKEIAERRKATKIRQKARREERNRNKRIDEITQAFYNAMNKYDSDGVDKNLENFNAELDRLSYLDHSTEPEIKPLVETK